jgi:hypothetical protein
LKKILNSDEETVAEVTATSCPFKGHGDVLKTTEL